MRKERQWPDPSAFPVLTDDGNLPVARLTEKHMSQARTPGTHRTLQALTRGQSYALLALALALVALFAIGAFAARSTDTPSRAPAIANAPVGVPSMRDPSVPEAGAALSADHQQPEESIPTF